MKKNHLIPGIFVALLCFTGIAGAANADYQPETAAKKELPLMVIRFNQPHVIFEKALYETVLEAFKVKPSAKFDVVSVSQKSGNSGEQKIYTDIAAQNTGRVMATFQEMGMPQNRINLINTSEHVRSCEVRIFVH